MKKMKDHKGRIVEVFFMNKLSETGKLMGVDKNFIFLENRIFYVEESKVHASVGDAWLSLSIIKQISIIEEDDDIAKLHEKYENGGDKT